MFLAASVFYAIKNAIKSARESRGLKGLFKFDAPATAERIRMACVDDITNKVSLIIVKNDNMIDLISIKSCKNKIMVLIF